MQVRSGEHLCLLGKIKRLIGIFFKDIQEMMFGLGDCSKPLESTAKIIEEVVLDQLSSILTQAEEISTRRNSKIISPQDLLFLMRNDTLKLQRLINYLGTLNISL